MSLKGYEWLDDNGKVIMCFTFKRLELFLFEDVSKEEYDKFIKFIEEEHTFKVARIVDNDFKII